MNNDRLAVLHQERRAKFDQIRGLIAAQTGLAGEALDEAAEAAVVAWEAGPEMEIELPTPATELQRLLSELHEICEQILNLEDDLRASDC